MGSPTNSQFLIRANPEFEWLCSMFIWMCTRVQVYFFLFSLRTQFLFRLESCFSFFFFFFLFRYQFNIFSVEKKKQFRTTLTHKHGIQFTNDDSALAMLSHPKSQIIFVNIWSGGCSLWNTFAFALLYIMWNIRCALAVRQFSPEFCEWWMNSVSFALAVALTAIQRYIISSLCCFVFARLLLSLVRSWATIRL